MASWPSDHVMNHIHLSGEECKYLSLTISSANAVIIEKVLLIHHTNTMTIQYFETLPLGTKNCKHSGEYLQMWRSSTDEDYLNNLLTIFILHLLQVEFLI